MHSELLKKSGFDSSLSSNRFASVIISDLVKAGFLHRHLNLQWFIYYSCSYYPHIKYSLSYTFKHQLFKLWTPCLHRHLCFFWEPIEIHSIESN